MKLIHWTKLAIFVAIILTVTLGASPAALLFPHVPPQPPRPPELQSPASALTTTQVSLQTVPLKAVLVVGPIDGDSGEWTLDEIANMELAAVELEASGVTVSRFYTPNNNWADILAATEGAHFFFYRGHGVYWGNSATPDVGGLALKDQFISSDQIRQELHLATNAIVMLYGCFTAGTSSSDPTTISSSEAVRRVAQYSDPFFDIGAGAYFANWFGDAFQMYVRNLFQGMTLAQSYAAYFDYTAANVEYYSHPDHTDLALWLDKDFWDNKWQYNNAFAGLPDATLETLFGSSPALMITPAKLEVKTDLNSDRLSYTISVEGAGDASFEWTAALQAPAGWVEVSPSSGSTGQNIEITIAPPEEPGVYSTTLSVTAVDPQLNVDDMAIPISLSVFDPNQTIYIPFATIQR